MAEPSTPYGSDAADPESPPAPDGDSVAPQPPRACPPGAPDAMLAMIERAARDPAVDLAKLEGLMAMKERVEAQRASIAFAEAFIELENDLPTIDRNGRIVIYSKADRDPNGAIREGATPIQQTPYATFDDILEALRPALYRHGFAIRFEHETLGDGRIFTKAVLRHRMGHQESATTTLKHDSTGSKNDAQAVGSANTYGKRYTLMAVLPLVSHSPQDADDDGRATGKALIDADQLAQLQQLLAETASDVAKFLETLGADGFGDITVKQFKRGKALLEEKKRRAKLRAAQ